MCLPAIILAAGASRRLGSPKQLVVVSGEALLVRTLGMVKKAGADPIIVVLGAYSYVISTAVPLTECHVVMNPNWDQGIASSIRAGLNTLVGIEPQTRACLLTVCDQPCLSSEHLRALAHAHEQSSGDNIVASAYGGLIGVPAIFPNSRFRELFELEGDNGARSLMRDTARPPIIVDFGGGEIDIDTPQDLYHLATGFLA